MVTTQEMRSQVADLEQTVADLERVLASRPVIDQAVGILMERHRCTAEESFRLLCSASQNRNIKLRVVAERLVREVSGAEPERPVFVPQPRRG